MNLKQLKGGDEKQYILYDYIYITKQSKLSCKDKNHISGC